MGAEVKHYDLSTRESVADTWAHERASKVFTRFPSSVRVAPERSLREMRDSKAARISFRITSGDESAADILKCVMRFLVLKLG